MGSIITTKKGLLKLVKGQIEVEVNGSNQPAKDGEQLPKGAVLHIGENATYEITFDDGTKLSNEVASNAAAAAAPNTANEAALDEIQALQDLIASGEDPTQNLPETAAGNAPAGSDGNSGYITLARDGTEALASAGYSTSGQTLTAATTAAPEQTIATDSPSVLVNDSITVNEDTVASGNVLDNDSDTDNVLSVVGFNINGTDFAAGTIVTLEGGSFILNADGSYTFTPNENWNGQVPVITYTTNTSSTATLTISVTPVDDPSVLANDSNTVPEDTVAAGNVLDNDSDIDNTLSVVSYSVNGQTIAAGTAVTLEGGSLLINADGSYTFTPNANWNGQVPVITYTTNTGSTATLTINVTPVDDAFTDANELVTLAEDSGLHTGTLLTGTSSVDGTVTVQSFTVNGTTYTFDTNNSSFSVALTAGTLVINQDGTYTFTPAANWNGAVPVVSYTLTDGSSTDDSTLTINVTPVDDPLTLVGLNGTEKTISEANLATGTQPNNAALTQSGSFSFSTLDGLATLIVAGTALNLTQLQALTASTPVTITTAYGTLTLTGFSGDTSGGTVSYSYTLNTKVDNDSVTGATSSGYIDSISVTVKDIDNNSVNNTLDINIVDDVIVLNEGNLNGTNAIGTYVGTGLLDTTGADQLYSADLSANVTGWNGTSVTFADSGITSGGKTLFYFVDLLNPSILYAYTDKSDTPSAFDASNTNQQLVFKLTAQPNSDSYTMQVYKSIDSLSEVVVAGLDGGEGGNSPAVYVGYNAATGQFDIDNNLSQLAYDLAFTLTSRKADGTAGTVNGNTGGFGANNAFVDSGEVFIIDYAKDVASATINFSSSSVDTLVHYKAYDKDGNLLGEGNIVSGGEISNLGAISHIELTTTGVGNDLRFQFNGTSAQEIVTSTQGASLNFDVTVKDSDGDTASGNFDVNLAAPGGIPLAPLALTINSTARLQEADLQTNGLDSDSRDLTFKAGSDAIGVFQFGDVSSIQVSGINANIFWALNDQGQLIGTVYGREAIRLTLDWDRINAGEQGDVTVTAELLTNLPHNVNTNNLTVNGIQVIAVDGLGNTAHSNVTVTVADDTNVAQNDTAQLDVVVDSFNFSGIIANWSSTIGGTYVNTYDGPDNDSGKDQLRWGDPSDYNGRQSGYGFMDNDAGLNGTLSLNQDIVLGTFTHYNYSIDSGTSITAATMQVTFNVTDAYGVVTPVTLTLNFSHNETPNSGDPMASRDIVTVGQTSVTFNYEGQMYTMQVIGFKDGNGNIVTSIYTNENAATSYELVVRMVAGAGYTLPHTDGNVLTNDVAGADGALTVIGVATGDHTNTGVSGQVGTTITGTYGNLVLNADGTYHYQLTASANTIPAAGAVETFTYTTQDSDGDKASATLKIDVNPVNADGINIADANLISTQGSSLNDTIIVEHGESANSAGQKVLNVSFGGGQSGIITNSSGHEVVASGANNKSYTTSSAQVVSGGDGNDHIETGKGNDVIYAGKTGSTNYGTDDQLELSANTLSTHHIMTGNITGNDRMVDSDGLLLANDVASQRADVVNSGSGDDRIYGQSGSDILYGHTGNDYIDGGSHNDALRGGAGNDTMIGGLGDDVLRGDSGNDTFVWRYADADKGTDHIMDFNVREDKLDLSDLLQGETANTLESYLNFSLDNNGSTVIDIDANKDGVFDQHIVLDGVNLFNQYSATDNAGVINGLLGSNGNGPLIIDTAPVTPEAPQGVTSLTDPHNNNGTIIP
ncbi:retention module-containing protein [Shewanella sp.]|uniref:retention module-containing protein n=1 Tax=Shewanella sp. TaxID=50422 RepID=UPI003A855F57